LWASLQKSRFAQRHSAPVQGVAGDVTIAISRDDGASFTTIASSVPNNGSFQWVAIAPASTQALIRVSSVNQPGVQDASGGTFRIRR
jgi:hypothetical protein